MSKAKTFVFTGDGKGKTTAAIGMVIRALGRNKKVVVIQFMKGRISGEIKILENLKRQGYKLVVSRFGSVRFVDPRNVKVEDIEFVEEGYTFALRALDEKPFLLVLDEILVATSYGMLDVERLLKLIEYAKSKGVNLVLTGRNAPREVVEKADLVTEMRKVKHYFNAGVGAEEGIEY